MATIYARKLQNFYYQNEEQIKSIGLGTLSAALSYVILKSLAPSLDRQFAKLFPNSNIKIWDIATSLHTKRAYASNLGITLILLSQQDTTFITDWKIIQKEPSFEDTFYYETQNLSNDQISKLSIKKLHAFHQQNKKAFEKYDKNPQTKAHHLYLGTATTKTNQRYNLTPNDYFELLKLKNINNLKPAIDDWDDSQKKKYTILCGNRDSFEQKLYRKSPKLLKTYAFIHSLFEIAIFSTLNSFVYTLSSFTFSFIKKIEIDYTLFPENFLRKSWIFFIQNTFSLAPFIPKDHLLEPGLTPSLLTGSIYVPCKKDQLNDFLFNQAQQLTFFVLFTYFS